MPLSDIVYAGALGRVRSAIMFELKHHKDWLSMNFKASINRAKNGTIPLNYRDTIAVRTERFSPLSIGQI
ncbi:hypothetical protein DXU03_14905 [Rhizobium johnstonii]